MRVVPHRALLVEDDDVLGRSMARALRAADLDVTRVTRGADALERLLGSHWDVVLLDLDIPKPDGWDILRRSRGLPRPPAVIVVSGNLDVESAARAMREGAVDCVSKGDFDEMLGKVRAAFSRVPRWDLGMDGDFVGRSEAVSRVLGLADRVAATPMASALIVGETGVGKEVVAHYIHRQSAARDGPYVAVNLAAIPDTLVETELFGHRRGAFTGSERDRAGKFRVADGGTLVLDELCEMKPALQSKLLRVVENGCFFPVGSDQEVSTSCRVLAATNRDPRAAIREGAFREDLYYRLATAVIRVPALRERPTDIPLLARHFLSKIARRWGRTPPELSLDAELLLVNQFWPGNVRQLRNIIERTALLSDGPELTAATVQAALRASRPPAAPELCGDPGWDLQRATKQAVATVERAQIRRALDLAEGSVGRAADLLGVSRTTLWSRLRRYEMDASVVDDDAGAN